MKKPIIILTPIL